MPNVLSTRDVSDLLSVDNWKIRRLFEDGSLPEPARLAGRRAIPPEMLPSIVDALRNRDWLPVVDPSQREAVDYEYEEGQRLTYETVQAAKSEWPRPIPVTERLPDDGEEYLAYGLEIKRKVSEWYIGIFMSDEGWVDASSEHSLDNVTHWLPLPLAPPGSP
jgi:hypothetical protein